MTVRVGSNRKRRSGVTTNRRHSITPIDVRKLTNEVTEVRNRLSILEIKVDTIFEHPLGAVQKPTDRSVTASKANGTMIDKLSTLSHQIMEFLDQRGPMTVSPQLKDLWKQLDEGEKLGAFAMALGPAKIARDRSRFVDGTSKTEPDPESYAEVIFRGLF